MQSVMSFLIKPCRLVAQLGLTDKVKLINPGGASAEHGSSGRRTVEEFFEEQETDFIFWTKFSLCFLWDQVPFTLLNSIWLLYLCLLHARHGLLACSIDECMMDQCCSQTAPLYFPPHPAFWPCWGQWWSLLIGLGAFTFLSFCLLSSISGPY